MSRNLLVQNIEALQTRATVNANKHSWVVKWDINDSPPQAVLSRIPIQCRTLSIGDALALVHSEVSEALEAYLKDDIKNFAEELADVVIRLLHLSGDLQIDVVRISREFVAMAHPDYAQHCIVWDKTIAYQNDTPNESWLTVDAALCRIHDVLSQALESYRDDNRARFGVYLVKAIFWSDYVCQRLNIPFYLEIIDKMNKNETRPVGHGRMRL